MPAHTRLHYHNKHQLDKHNISKQTPNTISPHPDTISLLTLYLYTLYREYKMKSNKARIKVFVGAKTFMTGSNMIPSLFSTKFPKTIYSQLHNLLQ